MSKLAYILEDMLTQARKQEGVTVKRTLGRGLRVELVCVSSDIRLTLAREDQFPSIQEWETVSRYFPITLEKVQPESRTVGKCHILTARFISTHLNQLKF